MTNTNHLEGFRCPKCGADDARFFYIGAAIEALDDHSCRCAACDHAAAVKDFQEARP